MEDSTVTALSLTLVSALLCLYCQKHDVSSQSQIEKDIEGARQSATAMLYRSRKRGYSGPDDLDRSTHSSRGGRPPMPRVPSYEIKHQPSDDNLAVGNPPHTGYTPGLSSRSGESVSNNGGQALANLGFEQPLVIAMVGLPARGKSYLVKMITRYLKWIGFECQVFNVGSHRRKMGLASAESNFFDSSNPEFKSMRENLAMSVQEEMYVWLHENENLSAKKRIAIFDATNTTTSRRLALARKARGENVFLLFVESICDDETVLKRNYDLKLQNEDYKLMDPETARKDFLSRVKEYEKVYEVTNSTRSFFFLSNYFCFNRQ
jgi:predicted kinase